MLEFFVVFEIGLAIGIFIGRGVGLRLGIRQHREEWGEPSIGEIWLGRRKPKKD